jgi:hypothetical protein
MKILAAILVLSSSAALFAQTPERDNAQKVYAWLLRQQGEYGLLGNQEDDNYSGLYPNALAAICYTEKGDIERAEKIFRHFDGKYDTTFATEPGGFFQFWNAANGEPRADTDRWIGDNAWLLIALNHHRRKTGSDEFARMRAGIAKWLISLQDDDGGILSGFNMKGPMNSKATEGNLDCYAALTDFPTQRKKIKRFLENKMWISKEKRFLMGSTSSDPALDCCSWAVSALGSKYRETLRYAEKNFLQTHKSVASGNLVTAFCDLRGKQRIWLEGTGEMVVAYQVAGEPEKAKRFLGELDKAMVSSQSFEGTAGLPCHTNDAVWPGGDEKIFVPSQCWYLLGTWGVNPMASE